MERNPVKPAFHRDHPTASAVESFKCSRCGHEFPTDGMESKVCPVCGRLNNRREDKVIQASIEEF